MWMLPYENSYTKCFQLSFFEEKVLNIILKGSSYSCPRWVTIMILFYRRGSGQVACPRSQGLSQSNIYWLPDSFLGLKKRWKIFLSELLKM